MMTPPRRWITHWMEGLSRAEYAAFTGGFAAGVLLLVGVLCRDSLLVEAVMMGALMVVFLYWFNFGGKQ